MNEMKHYIKILAILLAFVTVIGLFGCQPKAPAEPTEVPTAEPTPEPTPDINSFDYSEKDIPAAQLFEKGKVQGRTTLVDYKASSKLGSFTGIALDYTGAALEFNAYCEGTVTMDLFTKPVTIGGSFMYINVYVDGVSQAKSRQDFKFKKTAVNTVVLAENLPRGYHTFLIEKQTEAERCFMYVNSVHMQGELADKPANKDLYIEFVGDSITTGYGNLWPDKADGEQKTNPAFNEFEDGTRTFAMLTAKNLNADYSIVAQQGIGCVVGFYPHTMLSTYTKVCYQCNRKDEWGFEREPDVVVICLGTNDCNFEARGDATKPQLEKGFRDFLALVREKNPHAKIVWEYGMMTFHDADIIKGALADMGGEEAGFYFVEMILGTNGGNGHPSLADHAKNAERLTEALKTILGK